MHRICPIFGICAINTVTYITSNIRHWSTERTIRWFVIINLRTILIWINPFHNKFYSALMYVYLPVCITCADLMVKGSRPFLHFPGYNFWNVWLCWATFRLMAENVFAPPREFRKLVLSKREFQAASFDRCLHSVRRSDRLWQPVTYVTILNLERRKRKVSATERRLIIRITHTVCMLASIATYQSF